MKDKKTSKRQTLKKKYAIEKKCREHRKRVKKLLKHSNGKKGSKKQDAQIPNAWPFKLEMLREIQQAKLNEKEQSQRQRSTAATQSTSMQSSDPSPNPITSYEQIASCAASSLSTYYAALETNPQLSRGVAGGKVNLDLKKILEECDVILEVLDARNPNASRHVPTEEKILSQGKRLVLVLNKIDLVPSNVVDQWLSFLRRFHPTLAFKAGTTKSNCPLKLKRMSREVASEGMLQNKSYVIGASELMSLLKNYARSGGSAKTQTSITVGIIGEPNVGKSSVINSLCRNSSAVRVGGEPGITRHIQYVQLEKGLRLLDSPGVVRHGDDHELGAVLRNAVKLTNVKDPIAVVDYLLQHHSLYDLMTKFKVPAFQTTSDFLSHIATRMGKLKKGGLCDYESAARSVLYDWTSGKIQHYVLPPQENLMDVDDDKSCAAAHPILVPRLVSQKAEPMSLG